MSKRRGKEHEFLGMKFILKKGKVIISMKKHIKKAIDSILDDITRTAASPANNNLFQVQHEAEFLDEEHTDNYHSVVALLLYISRRCRLDIQTAVGCLTTKVSNPNEGDWKKAERVPQYLNGTIDLTLTLGADDITQMKLWVDVSNGVHDDDSRSHTAGCVSFGWGVLLTKCQKQKLNVKSSTEGEIVGVSDFLPNMIWARMFL